MNTEPFSPLPTPEEMARLDRAAIDDFGIPARLLMENAGRAAVETLLTAAGPVNGRRVLALAGPGNNGGDAFVAARLLQDRGADVLVLHTRPRKSYRGETRANILLAAKLGVPMQLWDGGGLPEADIILDGLLGTGFTGPLRPDMLSLVRMVNDLGNRSYVVALDIPSGLNGLTGRPEPEAVAADLTVTFHAAKTGLVLPEASPFVGALAVRDIGIPKAVDRTQPTLAKIMKPELLSLREPTAPDLHKGSAGRVLVVGGSEDYAGAPLLAALGALRAGAGLVAVACPAGLADSVRNGFPEIVIRPLGTGRAWSGNMARDALAAAAGSDAVVLGPGLGRTPGAAALLAALLESLDKPMVLDADGLNLLAESGCRVPAKAILTPHPGEMARLLRISTAQVQADRMAAVRRCSRERAAVAVLKGAGSIVALPDSTAYVCPVSAPCLATAGSGDVLSGLVAALLASGLTPLLSACLGVYWHSLSGKILERRYPARGNTAREIADALPEAFKEYACPPPRTS